MVPINPVEEVSKAVIEHLKEQSWAENRALLKFLLWELPTDLLLELFDWVRMKRGYRVLPEHWVDFNNGKRFTPAVTPTDLGSDSPYKH